MGNNPSGSKKGDQTEHGMINFCLIDKFIHSFLIIICLFLFIF
jgi:hypothetical protein